MSIFVFYDTDCNGEEEYDISGEEYRTLIKLCCKYCDTLSLRITHIDTSFVNELEKFATKKTNENISVYQHYYGADMNAQLLSEIRYYKICDELERTLLSISDSVFKWIYGWGYTNPEDPVFYRHDGSVFFHSIVHDGKCVLTPQANENVAPIILNKHWLVSQSGNGSSVLD